MATSCFLFLILIFSGMFLCKSGESNNTEIIEDNSFDALRRVLLMNIEKYEIPKVDDTKYTDIKISANIHHVDILDDQGSMNVHGFLKMKWHNKFFKWERASYNGISSMQLFPHEIWNPHMVLMNSASSDAILDSLSDVIGSSGVLIFSNGTAVWNPPFQFQVSCSLNLKNWPYDTQQCDIKVGTWHLKDYGIKLVDNGAKVDTSDHMSSQWEVTNIHTSTGSDLSFDYFTIHLTTRRDSSLYNPVLLTPAYCIILLSLSCFWLPPDSGEKIVLTGLNVLVSAGFLMYFAQLLPVLGKNVPLVVMFYSVTMLMITLSIIVSVGVMRLAHKELGKHCILQVFAQKSFTGVLRIMLCLNHVNAPGRLNEDEGLNPEVIDVDADSVTTDDNEDGYQRRFWIASGIDRLFWLIYVFVYIILVIVYSI